MGTVKGDSYRCYAPSHIGCRARPANFELRAELLDRKGDLALAEHQVLIFRDQPLDVESHKALGRYFGELPLVPPGFRFCCQIGSFERYRLVETRRLHQGYGLRNFRRLRVRPKSG